MDYNGWKRHSETHFANIGYGFLVFLISVLYVVFLLLLRRVVKVRPSNKQRSIPVKIGTKLYSLDPSIHLLVLFIPILIPFYYKYSLVNQTAVYIKRIGRLSYVLVTLNLFLSLRPNIFLRDRYVYTEFIPLHKWLSRLIVSLGVIHGAMFIVRWSIDPNVSVTSKITKKYNLVGVVLAGMVVVMVITSIGAFRRAAYRVFFVLHHLVMLSFIILTPVHARPGVQTPFLFINIFLLCLQLYNKTMLSTRSSALKKIDDYANTNMVVVQFPRKGLPDFFNPGSHVRVSQYRKLNPLYWMLPTHPYTISSLPSDEVVELIVAENSVPPGGGSSFQIDMGYTYTIQYPHNPTVPEVCLHNGNRITIVVGGSGISFGLPIFRFFKAMKQMEYIRLIWLTRNVTNLNLISKSSSFQSLIEESGEVGNFDVFITNAPQAHDEGEDETFEMTNLNEQSNGPVDLNSIANIHKGRRLDWAVDLSHLVQEDNSSTWLLCCGPTTLVDDAKHYADANGINFASEIYSL
ncbi:putative metalloreductase AIM14 [Nakaseomyces bracarensis]|uniref:Probable metalloreductase AIM14 n=1 Tax=Nakaseomyces bracarensis TaxID=273131 RepID=A0ABR4NMU0_9SACH